MLLTQEGTLSAGPPMRGMPGMRGCIGCTQHMDQTLQELLYMLVMSGHPADTGLLQSVLQVADAGQHALCRPANERDARDQGQRWLHTAHRSDSV